METFDRATLSCIIIDTALSFAWTTRSQPIEYASQHSATKAMIAEWRAEGYRVIAPPEVLGYRTRR